MTDQPSAAASRAVDEIIAACAHDEGWTACWDCIQLIIARAVAEERALHCETLLELRWLVHKHAGAGEVLDTIEAALCASAPAAMSALAQAVADGERTALRHIAAGSTASYGAAVWVAKLTLGLPLDAYERAQAEAALRAPAAPTGGGTT